MKLFRPFGSRRGHDGPGLYDCLHGLRIPIRDPNMQKNHRGSCPRATRGGSGCPGAAQGGDLDALAAARTALHLACASGHVKVVTLLVSRKCQIDICDKENRTPLIQAVHCQEEACTVILLEHGTNPNLKDIYRNTALHYAVYSESTSLAEKLLFHGANIEALDKDNNTPLLFAIICKKEKMVELLLKTKASTHAVDRLRQSALLLAIHYDSPGIVNILLKQNIDVFAKDICGRDAEDYAISHHLTKIQQQILEHKKKILKKDKPGKQCVPEKVSEPLRGPSHEKGNRIVNGKGEGPPAKHPSLKPSTEVEDPAVKGSVQRKDVQTLRAEQALPVASEEEKERCERSEKKQPQVKEGNNTNESEKRQLSKKVCHSTSSAAADRLTKQRKIGKTYPQQFPKKLKEEHDSCILRQENEEKTNVNMLEELERKEKQYKKEVEAKQLEPNVQSLEMKPKTARNTPNQINQSLDFHNHEEIKDLMDENCILKTDIAILRQEICTMKNDNLEKENKYLKDVKIVKKTNAALENYIKLNEELITKTAFRYQQELNDLKAENTRLNSELLKEEESNKRLEAEIESYQSRLAAAISKHSESVKTERNLKLALDSDIPKVEDKNEFLTEQLSKTQIKFNTLKDKFRKTRDTLRKKLLALETVQNYLSQTQQQIKEMKEMYQNAEAKVSNSTGKWSSVEDRICQLQYENPCIEQQLDDVHQKKDHKEIVTNIQRVFIESGKTDLMLEEKNKKLMNECDHLKESLFQYEREKAERVVSIKEDKYFQTSRKKI
uniref:CCDC144C-like coiled-coil domain-containing protein n=1 Tax=Pan troglodytes TaxID=9598 RepID=A0A2I3T686_PANTR